MASKLIYRGRFAPSPTGPLHMGSLLAAVASYLDAHAAHGRWLLRMEDIDPPREAPGAADSILRTLEAHGLYWDEDVLYQSTRSDAYESALASLQRQDVLFRCSCTRAALGPGGSCGGRCRPDPADVCALRLRLNSDGETFEDRFLGPRVNIDSQQDLVLKRKDGLYAYALAVVVDDGWQGVSDVVRGDDLLSQTHAQLQLFSLLNLPRPRYAHLPLLTDASGSKLSKQTGAPAIDDSAALDNLRCVLRYLGQASAEAPAGTPRELLSSAVDLWDPRTFQEDGAQSLVYPRPMNP